jgi:hypothetical protein
VTCKHLDFLAQGFFGLSALRLGSLHFLDLLVEVGHLLFETLLFALQIADDLASLFQLFAPLFGLFFDRLLSFHELV